MKDKYASFTRPSSLRHKYIVRHTHNFRTSLIQLVCDKTVADGNLEVQGEDPSTADQYVSCGLLFGLHLLVFTCSG